MLNALLLASVILAAPTQDESPRVRTRLSNGAIILIENMPKATTVSVQLFASSKRVPETKANSGHRHLLEHLIALGPGRNLDFRLETNGCFLNAHTLRDALQIEVSGPPGQLDLMLDALRATLQPLQATPEQIKREARVIVEELTLVSDSQKLSAAAWEAGYGESGIDPIGLPEALASATPESLKMLQEKHFAADGLVLVIAGPVSLQNTTAKARQLLGTLKAFVEPASLLRGSGEKARANILGSGEARAALVPGYKDSLTAAAIVAAFGIASRFNDSFVTYVPTMLNASVIVGRTSENSGLGLWIDAAKAGEEAQAFKIGQILAAQWIARQLAEPHGNAYLRGLLLVHGEAQRPELLLEAIQRLDFDTFQKGMALFRDDKAAIAIGGR